MVNYKLTAFKKCFCQNSSTIFYFEDSFKEKKNGELNRDRVVWQLPESGGNADTLVKRYKFAVIRRETYETWYIHDDYS